MLKFICCFSVSIILFSNFCIAQKVIQKPNVIIILSDQQSYDDLGCYGNKQVITPNLDKFAAQGVRLNQCFSNEPICTHSFVLNIS
jgi:arylsulfatase A-like enzyme